MNGALHHLTHLILIRRCRCVREHRRLSNSKSALLSTPTIISQSGSEGLARLAHQPAGNCDQQRAAFTATAGVGHHGRLCFRLQCHLQTRCSRPVVDQIRVQRLGSIMNRD